jgi:signal transduction histidine kinase
MIVSDRAGVAGIAAPRLLAEQVALMFRQTPAGLVGSAIIAGISLAVLARYFDTSAVAGWGAAVTSAVLLRSAIVIAYLRRQPPEASAPRWARAYAASALASGACWGAMGLLFFDPAQPLTVLFVGWVMAGMVTAAVPSLSNHLPAYAGFAVTATLPYAWSCAMVPDGVFRAFALFTVYFLAANLFYARAAHRTTAASIRLRDENRALLGELRVARDQAEAANRAKSVFFAAASHDLRQPAHALGLFVDAMARLLSRPQLPGRELLLETVGRMRSTLGSLGQMLASLLDTSRLEAGAMPVERGPVVLQERFDALAADFDAVAHERGLQLRFRATPLVVDSDALLLTRMLANLIANALKYTTRGGVLVACRRRGGEVQLLVVDTGIGIAAPDQARIFDEYLQLGRAAERRVQGLGLGLAIVRRMAQLLGHRVGLRSVPGRGSVFSLVVPLASERVAALGPLARAPAATRRTTVLVLDDEPAAREALLALLDAHGVPAVGVAGLQALPEALERAGPGDLVLVADYRLGDGRTGLDAVHRVAGLRGRPVPALIVTGETAPEQWRAVRASGLKLLHKPVAGEALIAALAALSPDASDGPPDRAAS